VAFEGAFIAGQRVAGHIVPTKIDPEVAATQKDVEGVAFEILVERIEPERIFSFRWHPYAAEKDHDYSKEERTLVTFELEATEGGTLLRVTETGFDEIPLARRATAFTMNEGGWEAQTRLVKKYVEGAYAS
jgi:uncharacterized protein YndB with AHSA1/START domain